MASDLPYLRAYPVALQEQARVLLEQGQLANVLLRKYRKKGRIYWERMPADADLY